MRPLSPREGGLEEALTAALGGLEEKDKIPLDWIANAVRFQVDRHAQVSGEFEYIRTEIREIGRMTPSAEKDRRLEALRQTVGEVETLFLMREKQLHRSISDITTDNNTTLYLLLEQIENLFFQGRTNVPVGVVKVPFMDLKEALKTYGLVDSDNFPDDFKAILTEELGEAALSTFQGGRIIMTDIARDDLQPVLRVAVERTVRRVEAKYGKKIQGQNATVRRQEFLARLRQLPFFASHVDLYLESPPRRSPLPDPSRRREFERALRKGKPPEKTPAQIERMSPAKRVKYYHDQDRWLRGLRKKLSQATRYWLERDRQREAGARAKASTCVELLMLDAWRRLDERLRPVGTALDPDYNPELSELIREATRQSGQPDGRVVVMDDQAVRLVTSRLEENGRRNLLGTFYEMLQRGRRESVPIANYHTGKIPRLQHRIDGMQETRYVALVGALDALRGTPTQANLQACIDQYQRYATTLTEAFVLSSRDPRLPELHKLYWIDHVMQADAGGQWDEMKEMIQSLLKARVSTVRRAGGDPEQDASVAQLRGLIPLILPGCYVVVRPEGDEIAAIVRIRQAYRKGMKELRRGGTWLRHNPTDERDSGMHRMKLGFLRAAQRAHRRGQKAAADADAIMRQYLEEAQDVIREIAPKPFQSEEKVKEGNSVRRMPSFSPRRNPGATYALSPVTGAWWYRAPGATQWIQLPLDGPLTPQQVRPEMAMLSATRLLDPHPVPLGQFRARFGLMERLVEFQKKDPAMDAVVMTVDEIAALPQVRAANSGLEEQELRDRALAKLQANKKWSEVAVALAGNRPVWDAIVADLNQAKKLLPGIPAWSGLGRKERDQCISAIRDAVRQTREQLKAEAQQQQKQQRADSEQLKGEEDALLMRQQERFAADPGSAHTIILEILSEGFGIPAEQIRAQLRPSDIEAFRARWGAQPGPQLDLYGRVLGAAPPSRQARDRMLRRLEPLERSAVNPVPPPVQAAFDQLVRSATWEQFLQNRLILEQEAERFLAQVPPYAMFRWEPLERLLEPDYTPAQRAALGRTAERVLRAFAPGDPALAARTNQASAWTRPRSLRAITVTVIDAGVVFDADRALFLRRFRSGAEGTLDADAAFDMPVNSGDPPVWWVSTAAARGSLAFLSGKAAHEYVHAELLRIGPDWWHQDRVHPYADWIAQAMQIIEHERVMQETGEQVLPDARWPSVAGIGPAGVGRLFQDGREAAGDPSRWERLMRSVEFLSPEGVRYAQGAILGGIARGIGEQLAASNPQFNPFERAQRFIAWYSLRASGPAISELVRLASEFKALPENLPGLEEAGQLLDARAQRVQAELARHPFAIRIMNGPDREQKYAPDAPRPFLLLFSKGVAQWIANSGLGTQRDFRTIATAAAAALNVPEHERISLLTEVDADTLRRLLEAVPGFNAAEREVLLRLKVAIDDAGMLGPNGSIEAALNYLCAQNYQQLISHVNQVRTNPNRNPRNGAQFSAIQDVSAIRTLGLWMVKEGNDALICNTEVGLVDGDIVQFVLNVAKDTRDSAQAVRGYYSALQLDFERAPESVMEPFGLATGRATGPRGRSLDVVIFAGEWGTGFQEPHLYPEKSVPNRWLFRMWEGQASTRSVPLSADQSNRIWWRNVYAQSRCSWLDPSGQQAFLCKTNPNAGDYPVDTSLDFRGLIIADRREFPLQPVPAVNLVIEPLLHGAPVESETGGTEFYFWDEPVLALDAARRGYVDGERFIAQRRGGNAEEAAARAESQFDALLLQAYQRAIPGSLRIIRAQLETPTADLASLEALNRLTQVLERGRDAIGDEIFRRRQQRGSGMEEMELRRVPGQESRRDGYIFRPEQAGLAIPFARFRNPDADPAVFYALVTSAEQAQALLDRGVAPARLVALSEGPLETLAYSELGVPGDNIMTGMTVDQAVRAVSNWMTSLHGLEPAFPPPMGTALQAFLAQLGLWLNEQGWEPARPFTNDDLVAMLTVNEMA